LVPPLHFHVSCISHQLGGQRHNQQASARWPYQRTPLACAKSLSCSGMRVAFDSFGMRSSVEDIYQQQPPGRHYNTGHATTPPGLAASRSLMESGGQRSYCAKQQKGDTRAAAKWHYRKAKGTSGQTMHCGGLPASSNCCTPRQTSAACRTNEYSAVCNVHMHELQRITERTQPSMTALCQHLRSAGGVGQPRWRM
jgi:hypothetical protein